VASIRAASATRSLGGMFGARFDDVVSGSSFVLTHPISELVATSITDVGDVIAAAADAAAAGHWVTGYVAYDAARAFDPSYAAGRDPTVPYAWFGVFGGRDDLPDSGPTAGISGVDAAYTVSRWTPLVDRGAFGERMAAVRRHIDAAVADQVRLTLPIRAAFSGEPEGLYADLLRRRDATHASHIWHDGTHILDTSGERFFRVDGSRVTVQPTTAFRHRGRWEADDLRQRVALETSATDRAVDRRIVDALRDDLGRVATPGSVRVERARAIERLRTVWRMSSVLTAELRSDVSVRDIFDALFPSASVVGVPRAGATQVIAEVESHPRGLHGGAIGVIPPGDGRDGTSFGVSSRTAVVNLDEGVAHHGVGGTVTAESDADVVYDEAIATAIVLTTPPSAPGLIETLRWDGTWLWLDEHLERMAASASFLGLDVPLAEVRSALEHLGRLLDAPTRVEVVATSAGDVSITSGRAARRFADRPGPDGDAVALAIDFDPVDRRDLRLYHRTSDRSPYEARAARHPDVDDVVLTNDVGDVTETTLANIVCRCGDRWITPPVSDGLLPGVLRRRLLDDGVISEESLSVGTLLDADAVAVIDSVVGWRPATVRQPG
jgi:para-aminobenzoate synthetase / 4-amino-4-deoxychorismate lyase